MLTNRDRWAVVGFSLLAMLVYGLGWLAHRWS